jgi:hypothetical protein
MKIDHFDNLDDLNDENEETYEDSLFDNIVKLLDDKEIEGWVAREDYPLKIVWENRECENSFEATPFWYGKKEINITILDKNKNHLELENIKLDFPFNLTYELDYDTEEYFEVIYNSVIQILEEL